MKLTKLALAVMIAVMASLQMVQAQEYEYVPLVREGVEWYYAHSVTCSEQVFQRVGRKVWFEGDTAINGVNYLERSSTSWSSERNKPHADFADYCSRMQNTLSMQIFLSR